MSNTTWIVIGIVAVALIIIIGVYLYQKSKNEADAINKDKLAIIQASLGGTLGQGYQQAGVGGWISSLLNSSSVTSLAGGFGSGFGSSLGSSTTSGSTTKK